MHRESNPNLERIVDLGGDLVNFPLLVGVLIANISIEHHFASAEDGRMSGTSGHALSDLMMSTVSLHMTLSASADTMGELRTGILNAGMSKTAYLPACCRRGAHPTAQK